MKRGSHAADDGSFNRSAAVHTGRAAVLLVVAFLIGVGLLHSADRSAVTIGTTDTTSKPKKTTTTSEQVTTTTVQALRDPKTIKVLSANGTSTNGVGAKLQRKVMDGGYDALTAVTASVKLQKTAVYFTAGFDGEAAALATFLGLQPTAAQAMPTKLPVAQLGTANIVVVAGTDIVPTLNATTTTTVRGATGGTTTTVRRSSTTVKSSSSSTSTTAHSTSSSSTTSTTAHSGTTTTTKP